MNDFARDAIVPCPLHVVVAEKLRQMILDGEIAPGTRLNERQLTQRFEISRTPVRDAMKRLAHDGLITLVPNRGAVVTPVTRKDLRNLFEVMAALEALAGAQACQRAADGDVQEVRRLHDAMRMHFTRGALKEYFALNQRIHFKIVDCAGNAELTAIYRSLSVRIRGARFMANFSRERWAAAMQEHELILEALTARDGPRLTSLLTAHLEKKLEAVGLLLAEGEDDASDTAAA